MSNVLSQELAIQEIENYLNNFLEVKFDVEKDYPKTLNAVKNGNLTFDQDLIPCYKLIQPLNKGTEFEVSKINFKTRVLPSVGASLAKGVDLQKDQMTYGLIMMAHITGFATYKELDNLSKKDYQLIQELSPVFM